MVVWLESSLGLQGEIMISDHPDRLWAAFFVCEKSFRDSVVSVIEDPIRCKTYSVVVTSVTGRNEKLGNHQ
jgi:hypothetical protein